MPVALFVLTCLSTWYAGGMAYAVALMTILVFHECGHFMQAVRYRVPASFPFFLPLPISQIGTLGAFIRMDGDIPNKKVLFDIGISGPLAGLIPTSICCIWGISQSKLVPREMIAGQIEFAHPLLFQWIQNWIFGPIPPDLTLILHPVAFAGWVGLLITALNLVPLSQLDGGHIFYAIAGKQARRWTNAIFILLIVLVIAFWLWHWVLMLLLIRWIGIDHPPTGNDAIPIDLPRKILGWLTLAFLIIGFTPQPIVLESLEPLQTIPRVVVMR